MNKVSKRGVLFLALGFCVVSFGLTGDEKQEKESKESIKIAKRYLKDCKNNETVISIGSLGFVEVREYWAKVPALKKIRDEFEQADEELRQAMLADDEYRSLSERMKSEGPDRQVAIKEYTSKKGAIFSRLQSDSTYRRARKKRDEALYECNIETFEYIIGDYEEKGLVMKTDWMKGCDCGHSH